MLLVTRGYGNGTFTGTIADAVLRGYTISEEVVSERNTGGWLSPEQVRTLKRIIRETEKARDNDSKKKKKDREKRLGELEAIYDAAHGVVETQPEAVSEQISRVVRPFSTSSDAMVPPAPAIDFRALLADLTAVRELAELLIKSNRSEEEVLLLLMVAA